MGLYKKQNMLILPKKLDLDKQKSLERKKEIDDGVALARRVDELRRLKLEEERRLNEWRETTLKTVQQEENDIIEQKNNLKGELETLKEERKELLKPLNKEWAEIHDTEKELDERIKNIYIREIELKALKQELEDEQNRISEIISKARKNEQDTEKFREEASSLRDLSQREYEMAKTEHDIQTRNAEKEVQKLIQREKEYEVASKTIEIREQQVKDKESELIIREKDLERRQRNFKIAQEAIKK